MTNACSHALLCTVTNVVSFYFLRTSKTAMHTFIHSYMACQYHTSFYADNLPVICYVHLTSKAPTELAICCRSLQDLVGVSVSPSLQVFSECEILAVILQLQEYRWYM
ncbi:unnamed protein product [Ceratitis capitata]|uniref:(Mediterranean fruit fly) hypothetical protein n=1 Tax=Ceratitis capitata TaxID=7213 RepID=A0A811V5F6_CERCA|nr:unnamed protein product [Ceratitis capitata]